jgi:hypothetical protein
VLKSSQLAILERIRRNVLQRKHCFLNDHDHDTTVPTVPPVFCAFFSFSFLDKGREEWKEKEKKA